VLKYTTMQQNVGFEDELALLLVPEVTHIKSLSMFVRRHNEIRTH